MFSAEATAILAKLDIVKIWDLYDRHTDKTDPTQVALFQLAQMIDRAASDLEYTENRLREQAETIRDRMTRTLDAMDAGVGINSLGEIQNSGSELDRLCAVRAEQIKALNIAIVTYTRTRDALAAIAAGLPA